VPNVENFDDFFRETVHDDIGRADEFTGAFFLSGPPKARKGRQLFNSLDKTNCATFRAAAGSSFWMCSTAASN
jgi:hypothetical protein